MMYQSPNNNTKARQERDGGCCISQHIDNTFAAHLYVQYIGGKVNDSRHLSLKFREAKRYLNAENRCKSKGGSGLDQIKV